MGFIYQLFLGSWLARVVLACGIGMAAIWGYGLQQKHEGKVEVKQEAQLDGTRKNAEAKKNVDQLSNDKYYAKRLQQYCRDCKG